METTSDAELVELARSGKRHAYDELIRRHQRALWGLACTLLGDPVEAEDMAQEAFLRAWLNLDLLNDPAKFGSWLRRIVFGVSIDWLRVFRPDLYRLADADTALQLANQPCGAKQEFAKLQDVELRQRVWDAVARLPDRYRLPLTLFHLDGLSHAKVAEALNLQESTARSLVTRARQKLEPMLSGYAAQVLPGLEDIFKEQSRTDMIHIADGDSVAGTLKRSGLPGAVAVCGDLMYEGPTPSDLSSEDWIQVRAEFLHQSGFAPLEETKRYVKAAESALEGYREHDEVVLWLDHRLSDQLILIRVLDWFSRRNLGRTRLSLICLGRYPGTEPFIGLGQLKPDQLASLADTRASVTDAQFREARAAWSAFTAPDPTAIESLIKSGFSSLPFLGTALRRHLQQFPAMRSGLSRTELTALSILRERGPLLARQLFVAVQAEEELLFMGDSSFYRMLRDLASARYPLVEVGDRQTPYDHWHELTVSLTTKGLSVIEGRDDNIHLNGIDRWVGGVHLQSDNVWRWDESTHGIRKTAFRLT